METELEARIAEAIAEHERGSASPQDRDDPSVATEIVARLLPQPGPRGEVLRVFAELIERAHGHGERKWAVTLFADRVRLNVGSVHVGVILHGVLFLVVDPATLDEATRAVLGPRLRGTRSFKFTGPAVELYLPAEDVAALWPKVRAASQTFVDTAASRDTSFYNSHSPGFLGALEAALRSPLPRPAERLREILSDITAVVTRARQDLPPARVAVRERALADARQLIETNRRSLSAEALVRLMRLFNTDLEDGRERVTRFGQAMGGHSRNRIVEQADVANHWIDALWACESDADAAATIDRLRKDSPLPNAGLSFPTMVLHCKAPERWFPAQSGMLARGYARLTGVTPTDGPSYIGACELLRRLVAEYKLPVVGLDVVAYFADHPEYVQAPGPPEDDAAEAPPTPITYDRTQFLAETLFEDAELTELERLLQDRPQLVLCGPPGTGKTWIAERLARLRTGGDRSRIEVVQFHPSYGYEDFIEGIRPTSDGGQMTYPVVPGVFLDFCERATRDPGREHVLVIDEINRGNLPRIFGELLFALERRGDPVTLSQSRRVLRVPHNLVLLGTMNTADQSIAPLDMALRRRFHFYRLEPEPERLERWLEQHASRMKPVAAVMRALNTELKRHGVTRDRLVGHSHFMRPGLDEDALALIWRGSVLPLVEELLHGREELLSEFDYETFVERRLVRAP